MKDFIRTMNDVSRRDFAAYMAKACLGVGILPFLSGIPAYGAAAATQAATAGKNTSKRLIYLYMGGGMSHLDSFDPKPDNKSVMGTTETIDTNVSGMRLGSHLSRLAKMADKFAVINSMRTTTGAHEEGRYYIRTSYAKRGTIVHPPMGSWMLALQGRANDVLPGAVALGGSSQDATAGFFENKYAPVPLESATSGLPNSRRDVDENEFMARLTLANSFDKPFRQHYKQKQVRSYTDLYADAIRLMNSDELAVFDITKEPEDMKTKYGMNGFGQGCLLARRLVEKDVRSVEVNFGGWDTHTDNFDAMEDRLPMVDQGISALLSDLESRGLLKNTLVVLATEFGRTPRINPNKGRDHHPRVFSTLLAGAGIKAGQAYGKSSKDGEEVADLPVSIPDFNATIGTALGIPIKQIVKAPSGRPFTFADKGEPIAALLA
jgi:hypothetical protein